MNLLHSRGASPVCPRLMIVLVSLRMQFANIIFRLLAETPAGSTVARMQAALGPGRGHRPRAFGLARVPRACSGQLLRGRGFI